MTWVLHGMALIVAWTGWPLSLHGSALLLVPTIVLPGGFTLQVHTVPSLHLPLFLEETFLHTLVSILSMECKLLVGHNLLGFQTTVATKGHSLNHGRVCSMIAQCGLCLGGQPRVGCGR